MKGDSNVNMDMASAIREVPPRHQEHHQDFTTDR
jgi:hypothetical protein